MFSAHKRQLNTPRIPPRIPPKIPPKPDTIPITVPTPKDSAGHGQAPTIIILQIDIYEAIYKMFLRQTTFSHLLSFAGALQSLLESEESGACTNIAQIAVEPGPGPELDPFCP